MTPRHPFFLLAAHCLLLEDSSLITLGLCAGFCYAIKMPGILIALCAIAWLLLRWRVNSTALILDGGRRD